MISNISITGIHTDIGKTIATAVLAEALKADYWKPVQAGNIEDRDSLQVQLLISNGANRVHPESVILSEAISPHEAAKIDGKKIDFTTFTFPKTKNLLLIETAGGVLSPMADNTTMADFVKHYQLPTILVTNNYLGSINHSLLSIEVLQNRGINILGIIANGHPNSSSEAYIEKYSGIPIIARIPFFKSITAVAIQQHAALLRASLLEQLKNVKH
ncbi:MAG: dethiobiotin synthase [Bacteroidota bacterium]